MHISLVVLFCLFIVVVNSTTTKTTRRHVVITAGRGTTKAPAPKSAYAYLRTVRGKSSCASGSCPFWERHGRSFVSLRCYSQEYQDCTCLHRMCFSSCMFSREVCNQEMVSCLRQICPRCLPASQLAMCSVYDSMAVSVANALSAFSCYACCPNAGGSRTNNSTTPRLMTITPPVGSNPVAGATNRPNGVQNGGARPVNGGSGSVNGGTRPVNGGSGSVNGGTRPTNGGAGSVNGGSGSVNGGARPTNGGARPTNGGARPTNGGTGSANGGINRPSAGNQGNANGNNNIHVVVIPGSSVLSSNNNGASKRVQKTVRPPRVVTTRRTSATTRRSATIRTTVRTQKP